MKLCILCFSFIRKNIFPILITVTMLTVAMFILTTFVGEYHYMSYTRDVLNESELQNGVYFMMPSDGDAEREDVQALAIRKKMETYDACAHVLTNTFFVVNNEHDFCNAFLYNRAMRENFCLEVTSGRWLSAEPAETEAVIGGVTWGNTRVGDIITLSNGITARVVGIMGDDVLYPSFTSYDNHFQTANLLFDVNDTVIFLSQETIDPAFYTELYSFQEDRNCYVVFSEQASETEKQEVIRYLQTYGAVVDYDTIMENSEQSIREWVARAFPLPLFLIVVSTISVICICTVIVKRSMADHSKYFLVGCSKTRGFWAIVTPLTVMFSIPCLLNTISILWFPDLFRAGDHSALINYVIRPNAIIPVIGYEILMVAVLYLIPWFFYRHYTPIAFYRRNL